MVDSSAWRIVPIVTSLGIMRIDRYNLDSGRQPKEEACSEHFLPR